MGSDPSVSSSDVFDPAFFDLCSLREQAHDGRGCQTFARATFTDEGNRAPGIYDKRDTADNGAPTENDVQSINVKERLVHV
jgi:hypothetical protein